MGTFVPVTQPPQPKLNAYPVPPLLYRVRSREAKAWEKKRESPEEGLFPATGTQGKVPKLVLLGRSGQRFRKSGGRVYQGKAEKQQGGCHNF